ncbi:MAG: hypothetical protein JWP12_595 [Bacteroidetes bacterium]|nr:hypothetical protein [Bacteroidota bacterium]
MMKNYNLKTRLALAITCCMVAFSINVKAQLTGTKNIPGDYATLALAITDLNTQGVGAGGVTLNVIPGNPETAPAGGYVIGDVGSLVLTTASATNPIIIQGNNNIITAAAAPVVGSRTDAIIKIIGGDYITIQDLTLNENAANTTGGAIAVQQMTEFGIALFAVSTTDGAQFNTILNNTITLSSATAYQNAIGIFSTNASSATNGTQAASSSAGTNSNNKFYNNTISGVAFGIYFISPAQTATVFETGNDIGGTSAGTGNHITFGVSNTTSDLGFTSFSAATNAGIYFRNVVGFSARFNTVTSTSTLTLPSGGVFATAGTTPTGVTYTSNFSNNTVTLTNTGTTAMTGIDFGSGITNGTIIGSNNTVVLNQTATASVSANIFGIRANYTNATNTCSNNNVTINQSQTTAASSGNATGITMAGTSATITGAGNTVTLNQTGSGTGTLTGLLGGIDVSGSSTNNNVTTNTITVNQTTSVASGINSAITVVKATNAASTALNVTGNGITVKQAVTGAGTYGSANIAYISYNASHNNVNITGNTFNTTGSTIRNTGTLDVVLGGASTLSGLLTVKTNTSNIDRVATSGNVTFFNQSSTSPNDPYDSISSNNITFTNLATSGTVIAINRIGGSTAAINSMCNNIISISGTNTGSVTGIAYSYGATTVANGNSITVSCAAPTVIGLSTPSGAVGTTTLKGNTFSLASSATAPASMVGISGLTGGPYTISNNTFNALNFTGVITGSPTVSAIGINTGTGNIISNNVIANISVGAAASTATPTVDGILVSGGTSTNVFKNKIYGITTAATGTTTVVNGIRLSGGTTNTVYNNFIGGLTAPAAASVDAIRGISITSTSTSTTHNIYYNTVYLNASSTGANFGATGIYHTVNATASTSQLNLRNNIIVNGSTPAGTGLVVAFRRSGTALNNYAATSNNNVFYAGTPGAANLIFNDGTNSDQTIAAYQTRAGGVIDAASKTENVVFTSTVGTAPGFLHVAPATPTVAESAAANIATYTDDFDGDIRQGNAGYAGTGTAPDIGADEFAGISALPLCASVTAGTGTATPAAVCVNGTSSITVTGATSSSTSAGITYQWVKATSAVGPYTVIGGATTTTLATGALPVTTYFKFVVACSNSGLTDSTAAITVTVNPSPTIVVTPTSASICQPGGTAIPVSATGATTYAWAPSAGLSATTGSSVNAAPTATTTYTITGTDGNGCIGTGTTAITVNGAVTGLTATATPSSVCSGGNSQLLAFGSVATPLTSYVYSTSTGATLDPMTGATTAIGANDDDTPTAAAAAIGFPFNFNGRNYTKFSVSPDGWILLDSVAAVIEYTNAMTATNNVPKIAPYWDDLATGTNGSVTTLVTGTAPNRILKVQWFVNIPRNTTGVANSTFQAWLYEGGRIEFRYGAMGTPSSGSISGGLTATAASFHSLTFATNTSSTATANDANSTAPATGRMYVYAPAAISSFVWTPSTFITGQETLANPIATAVTTTTTYTVTASNGGCTSTASVTLTAGAALTSTNSVLPSGTVCAGTNLTFNVTAAGGGAPYTFAWAGPNSFASTAQSPVITAATPAATGTYTVTVTDNCAATSTTTVLVTVNALPAVAVTPTSALYCNPGTGATLTASAAATYAWLPATGLSAATGASVIATPASTTTYTVTGTDGNGCVATATTTITSAPAVVGATATATPAAVCTGSPTALGATGNPYTINILSENFNGAATGWTTANNSTGGTVANAAWTLRPNGYSPGGFWTPALNSNDNSQFYLTNSDSQGSGSTSNTTLQSPSFNTVGLASLSLQFYNYFRFNAAPDSANVEVSTNGTTWALVQSTNGATLGAVNGFVTTTVNLNAYIGNPTVYVRFHFKSAWGYGWAIDNVAISGGASSYTYSWTSAPAGFTSTTQNPTGVIPTATTDYNVVLTNVFGCSATATTNVVVNPLPSAPAASGTTICSGTTATLTAAGTGTIGWYDAAAAGTHVGSGASFTTPALTTATTYYVQDSSAAGCPSARTAVAVAINALPAVVANSTAAAVCDGGAVTLTGSGATSYTWTGGVTDGLPYTPAATDTYTVTGTDGNGCMNTATAMVTVNALPAVVANSTAVAVCDGSSVTLTGSGAATYTWTGTVTDGLAFTPAATDTYTVTGTDGNGCINTASTTVTVNTLPTVTASADLSTVCAGNNVTLTGGGATSYTWTTGVTDGVPFAPAATDTYTVTGTDGNGCTNTATTTVTVNTLPTVTASADLSTVCAGNNVTLTGGGATSYTWTTGVTDGVPFAPTATDTYTVTGTDASGCSNTATTTVTVNTLPAVDVTFTSGTVCVYNAALTLSGATPAGGTWSGNGVSGTSFDPATAGVGMSLITYSYTDVNGCANTDTTSINVDVCTGIAAANASTIQDITVYPNPASGMVNISVNNANFTQLLINIVDIQGKEVYNELDKNVSAAYNKQINIEGFAKGVYYVRLTTGTDSKVQKLVIQ